MTSEEMLLNARKRVAELNKEIKEVSRGNGRFGSIGTWMLCLNTLMSEREKLTTVIDTLSKKG